MEAHMDPPGNFPLIVRGGGGVNLTYDDGTLSVQFRKSSVAAGQPTTYGRMPTGSAAWVDRPVNDAEPSVVRQQMPLEQANQVNGVLHNEVGFWNFVCHNTNAGHFEAVRSERVFSSQRIDDNP
jgi:hypothetical protein